MNVPTNIEEKITELEGKAWSPIDIAEVSEYVIRLALFLGEYHWHKHDNEDELFYVYKGEIKIKIRNQKSIIVKEGELFVVPKGIEHKPTSTKESYILLFELSRLKSTGD